MINDQCPGGCGRILYRGRFTCAPCFGRLPIDLQRRARQRQATEEEVRAHFPPPGDPADAWTRRDIRRPRKELHWPRPDRGF